jgi:UDP-N-acetyl-2-amino-2-deoxyglucuronate dehydrogenase
MTVRYGLIGSGTMGLVYAEALATQVEDGELVAISGGQRAPRLAKEYGVVAYDTPEHMLEGNLVDAVIIATPHTTHLPYTRMVAAAGKHVFCEKPMAVTVEECDEMIAVCAEAGVLLTVAAQSRRNPVIQATKELLDEGAIGPVRMIRILSSTVGWDIEEGSWAEDPREGGAFLDWGVHAMNTLSWFTGARASRVFATFANFEGSVIPDISAMVQYEMDSGVMVQIWMSYEMPAPGLGSNMHFTIVGEKGILDMDRYSLKHGTGESWIPIIEIEGWNWLTDPKNPGRIGQSAAQVQDFSRCIIDGTEPDITGAQSRDAVEMIDYARRSAASHTAMEIPARKSS